MRLFVQAEGKATETNETKKNAPVMSGALFIF